MAAIFYGVDPSLFSTLLHSIDFNYSYFGSLFVIRHAFEVYQKQKSFGVSINVYFNCDSLGWYSPLFYIISTGLSCC